MKQHIRIEKNYNIYDFFTTINRNIFIIYTIPIHANQFGWILLIGSKQFVVTKKKDKSIFYAYPPSCRLASKTIVSICIASV